MKDVIVVTGPGQIGQAIVRRVGAGKHLILADKSQDNAEAAAEMLTNVGDDASVSTVDVPSRGARKETLARGSIGSNPVIQP
jgi:NAD(P)-dependent dehydrogenase (short-subunit alcohol dehydrogenase family)